METVIKIIQFLLSFSVLIIIHELGHFMFARLFGVRVEKFQLFFGKTIISFKRGDTVYGIGMIPVGGYVALYDPIEDRDRAHIDEPMRSCEFSSKKAWQRLLIMSGGVIMNVILAFMIFVGISYVWGDHYFSTNDMKYGYVFSEEAKQLGFEDGDRILTIDGRVIDDFDKLRMAIVVEQNAEIEIERNGDTVKIVTPEASIMKLLENPSFMAPRRPFLVGQIIEGGGAHEAGITSGDRLTSINGKSLFFFDEFQKELSNLKGQAVEVGYERDSVGVKLNQSVVVNVSEDGLMGVAVDIFALTPVHTRNYTFWQSFPAGVNKVSNKISEYWKQLKLIVKPKTEAYKSIGGPLAIGSAFPGVWDWHYLWNLTALLSIVLAVMNILPIPALDGGRILFILFEMITGRKPGDNFMVYTQLIGFAILISVMIYATFNDIHRIFIK